MKKWIMISLITFIMAVAFVLGATPTPVATQTIIAPEFDTNQIILNKIDTEEKATRQYFSTELQRQNSYFISEFTKRADYYERRYQEIMNEAVLKLGVMWAGIFIVSVSITSLINYWAEKRRYGVLKKALKMDVVREIKNEYVMIPDKEIKILNDYLVLTKQIQKGEKKEGFIKRLFSKKKVIIKKEESKLAEPQHAPVTNNEVMEDLITKMKRGKAL
jgi:hypothetical protein